ncbi:hypothetical protein JARJAR_237 [Bacillus phage vB_BanH_JarJar]|nr:hypothetical protein JARJAR_237 [Bacillus phage vB_BanH_JarJar]UGO50541.1 hypothetical protein RONSWANSON_235 [Bacillus phage vB_BanH_RonSwanson]
MKRMEVFTLAKTKISSPVDFENLDTETLIKYAEFYTEKVMEEDSTMWTYYYRMQQLAYDELDVREEAMLKVFKKVIDFK